MSEETSFYKQIDGKKYSRRILDLADELTAGRGDGRISATDAQQIFDSLKNDGKYTDLEKQTLAYVRVNYRFTERGDEFLRGAIRS